MAQQGEGGQDTERDELQAIAHGKGEGKHKANTTRATKTQTTSLTSATTAVRKDTLPRKMARTGTGRGRKGVYGVDEGVATEPAPTSCRSSET